ncbi:hypothetical protein OUZ56_032471 [Daphnia magna]|uniref:Uncharacterized protein n=1 Tax=Daphnia magna TaxID=35525 RepID=A0ABR0B914_9CRUS|nr:hypothetical protein OUZ56_032471 [Daphnia magna]
MKERGVAVLQMMAAVPLPAQGLREFLLYLFFVPPLHLLAQPQGRIALEASSPATAVLLHHALDVHLIHVHKAERSRPLRAERMAIPLEGAEHFVVLFVVYDDREELDVELLQCRINVLRRDRTIPGVVEVGCEYAQPVESQPPETPIMMSKALPRPASLISLIFASRIALPRSPVGGNNGRLRSPAHLAPLARVGGAERFSKLALRWIIHEDASILPLIHDHAPRRSRLRSTFNDDRRAVLEGPGTAAGDHGDVDRRSDRTNEVEVVTAHRTVVGHRSEKDLAGAVSNRFLRPRDDVAAPAFAPSVGADFPATKPAPLRGVDGDNAALTAEPVCSSPEQPRVFISSRIHGNFLRAKRVKTRHLLHVPYATAVGERHETLSGNFFQERVLRLAIFRSRADVQEAEFIHFHFIVNADCINRITDVFALFEPDRLHKTSALKEETRNHPRANLRRRCTHASSAKFCRSRIPCL